MQESRAGITGEIKQATWHCHAGLESLPFVTALTCGNLPLVSYVAQLRGFAVMFGALERVLGERGEQLAVAGAPLVRARSRLISADLAYFAPQILPDLLPAIQAALAVAARIRAQAGSLDALAAFLYVLQGTSKGNAVHLPDVKACFGLEGMQGCSFYAGTGEDTAAQWDGLCSQLDLPSLGLDPGRLKESVLECYGLLETFHRRLYPVDQGSLGVAASSLNPEAGDHAVPQDGRILAAALRAGERCWREFSYFEKRYGARGRRYTDSDVSWLATLAGAPEEVAVDQVFWLGRLLSRRGMPILLLERQLELLCEELSATDPGPAALLAAIAALKAQRDDVVCQAEFDRICRAVRDSYPGTAQTFPDLPLIVASGYADQLSGIPECFASIATWLKEEGYSLEGLNL
jgi:heme oxygenase